MFLWIVLIAVLGGAVSVVLWTSRNRISPMPTSAAVRKVLLEHLPKDVEGPIIELGSGWGTIAIPLARSYRHCEVIAYETSPLPFAFSKFRQLIYQLDNLQILRKDFFEAPLDKSDFIYCYLYPDAMQELKPKFEAELPPGAYVISNTFAVPGWTEEKIYYINDLYHTPLYIYRIPKKRD